MPARELLALADRWRDDPTAAGEDGELLAATRAGLASLDGRERAAIGHELRARGQGGLADRLEVSDRLPVWSDEFTGVARDLLSLDATTLGDLLEVVDPDAVSALAPPVGTPVDLPPPTPQDHADGGDAGGPAVPDLTHPEASDSPPVDEGADAARLAAPDPDVPGDAPGRDAPADPTGEAPVPPRSDPAAAPEVSTPPAWEARRWQPRDPTPHASPELRPPSRADAPDPVPGLRREPSAAPSLAPGQRSTVVARTRFAHLAEQVEAGTATPQAHDLITEAPDGWQRRRVILRLLDAGVADLDVAAVLSGLGRDADRTTVADRLVRHGVATLAQVAAHLSPGAAARLERRHG